jgi:hypothetical protein
MVVQAKDQRASASDLSAMQQKLKGGEVYAGIDVLTAALSFALVGSAFTSECFFMQMLFASGSFQFLAYVAFLGRLVHLVSGIYLLSRINNDSNPLFKMMNNLMRTGTPPFSSRVFSVLSLLCVVDVTLVSYMPWLKSGFAEKTRGYPTRFVFLLCVYDKLLQTTILLACQGVYFKHVLAVVANLRSTPLSVVFLGLNLSITALVFVVSFVEATNKTSSLKEWEKEDKRSSISQGVNPLHEQQQQQLQKRYRQQQQGQGQGQGQGQVEMTGLPMTLESAAHVDLFSYPVDDIPEHLRRLSLEHRQSLDRRPDRASLQGGPRLSDVGRSGSSSPGQAQTRASASPGLHAARGSQHLSPRPLDELQPRPVTINPTAADDGNGGAAHGRVSLRISSGGKSSPIHPHPRPHHIQPQPQLQPSTTHHGVSPVGEPARLVLANHPPSLGHAAALRVESRPRSPSNRHGKLHFAR